MTRIEAILGDLTTQQVDAIVNAANSTLLGPNRNRGQSDPSQLASCFASSLNVARSLGAHSVAFPAVSAGAYGWAAEDAAQVAVGAVRAATSPTDPIMLVRFVLSSPRLFTAFDAASWRRPERSPVEMTRHADDDRQRPACRVISTGRNAPRPP